MKDGPTWCNQQVLPRCKKPSESLRVSMKPLMPSMPGGEAFAGCDWTVFFLGGVEVGQKSSELMSLDAQRKHTLSVISVFFLGCSINSPESVVNRSLETSAFFCLFVLDLQPCVLMRSNVFWRSRQKAHTWLHGQLFFNYHDLEGCVLGAFFFWMFFYTSNWVFP